MKSLASLESREVGSFSGSGFWLMHGPGIVGLCCALRSIVDFHCARYAALHGDFYCKCKSVQSSSAFTENSKS
jgi:hypothetical protein